MRIDSTIKLRQMAGENIIIRQNNGVENMTNVVGLNETAVALYNALKDTDFTLDDVARYLCDNYEVDAVTARHDAAEWVEQLRSQNLLVS